MKNHILVIENEKQERNKKMEERLKPKQFEWVKVFDRYAVG